MCHVEVTKLLTEAQFPQGTKWERVDRSGTQTPTAVIAIIRNVGK